MNEPLLIVLLGPTGVGKTELSLRIAEQVNAEIFSADSRQMYRGIEISTAAPTPQELSRVPHHFIGFLDLHQYYSAAEFEADCMNKLTEYFDHHPVALLTGGSMLYIDALCKGIDDIPTVTPDIRQLLLDEYHANGLQWLQGELRRLDPLYYERVDKNNHKRVLHAVELCRMTGVPFSSFHTGAIKHRPFRILRIGLSREREELYQRINSRVEIMVEQGLVEEARGVFPLAHLNSLNTVGLKEMFVHFRGECSQQEAVEKIQQHSRIYSRKQTTWYRRDETIRWFHPSEEQTIMQYINSHLQG